MLIHVVIRKTGWSEYNRSFISSWSLYVQFEVVIVIIYSSILG